MPQVGFETTIPMFERVKTVHAFDCAATVIGGLPAQHGGCFLVFWQEYLPATSFLLLVTLSVVLYLLTNMFIEDLLRAFLQSSLGIQAELLLTLAVC
jgi:hypothetical protein